MLGYVCPRGVSAPEHAGIHTAACEQNDWQTGVKTLPCRNYVADGNKSIETRPTNQLHDSFKPIQ